MSDVETRLRETFAAHEHLADPDRAVAIATSPGRPPRRGRVLLGAAAAVALVVAGSTYALTRGDDRREVSGGFVAPPSGVGSAADVTRANRAFAERIADQALDRLRIRAGQLPGGTREVRAGDVPALEHLMTFIGPGVGHNFTRSAFFQGPGDAHQVALWFAAHPPAGTWSDGGPTGVGGSRNSDGSWSDEADFDYRVSAETTRHASLAGLVQVTPQGSGVGLRVTVFGSWRPGRPSSSFAHDVLGVRVRVKDWAIGSHGDRPRTSRHAFDLTSTQVRRVAARFNALPGGAAVGMSCPMPRATRTYRLIFDTSSGTLTVTGRTGCGGALYVQRDGRDVPPMVDAAGFYGFLDRELSLPALPQR